jgi:hypothetical protein
MNVDVNSIKSLGEQWTLKEYKVHWLNPTTAITSMQSSARPALSRMLRYIRKDLKKTGNFVV